MVGRRGWWYQKPYPRSTRRLTQQAGRFTLDHVRRLFLAEDTTNTHYDAILRNYVKGRTWYLGHGFTRGGFDQQKPKTPIFSFPCPTIPNYAIPYVTVGLYLVLVLLPSAPRS